jgi:hypothetical protein
MMNSIDAQIALCDLSQKTSEFFVSEIPAHGETRVRNLVVEALKRGLEPCGTAKRLLTKLT